MRTPAHFTGKKPLHHGWRSAATAAAASPEKHSGTPPCTPPCTLHSGTKGGRRRLGGLLQAALVASALLAAGGCQRCSPEAKESADHGAPSTVTLLNVSYDPTREFYAEFNRAFARHWEQTTQQRVVIQQSHGGSGKQARAVIDGLEADVVTLALAFDVTALHQQAQLLPADWQTRLPLNSVPYYSTIVLVVRVGNPKAIKDWSDLVRPEVAVVTPNPKTSGGARWNYLAAWGYALRHYNGDASQAQEFMRRLFANVPILDAGARGSLVSFAERGIGDVLIAWENEALLLTRTLAPGKFAIIRPSLSIRAQPPVAVVDRYAEKHGTRAIATAYLEYLYSDIGQDLAAQHFYRPNTAAAAARHTNLFPPMELMALENICANWSLAHAQHFADGALFDQIFARRSQ